MNDKSKTTRKGVSYKSKCKKWQQTIRDVLYYLAQNEPDSAKELLIKTYSREAIAEDEIPQLPLPIVEPEKDAIENS